jgi:hypothetical protein
MVLVTVLSQMTRTLLLAVGALLAVTSACVLAVAVFAGQGDRLGADLAWLEPYLGSGGAVAAGSHHEGLQG